MTATATLAYAVQADGAIETTDPETGDPFTLAAAHQATRWARLHGIDADVLVSTDDGATWTADAPTCPASSTHGPMAVRTQPGTREQAWCGTWYDCQAAGCSSSVLIRSPELEAQLAEQRDRLAATYEVIDSRVYLHVARIMPNGQRTACAAWHKTRGTWHVAPAWMRAGRLLDQANAHMLTNVLRHKGIDLPADT